jgi:hypothetical protein
MTILFDPSDNAMLRAVLDAMPSAVFVVDADVRIMMANRAARELIRSSGVPSQALLRAGEALHCLHAFDHPDGCGRSADCSDCVIRGAVGDALAGKASRRLRTRMNLSLDGHRRDVYLQVTASGFEHQTRQLALLVMEDISAFAELRKIVPICAQCKKIRQDEDYWQSVENYVGQYMDLSFSHSYCPSCKQDMLNAIDAAHVIPGNRRPRSIDG